MSKTNSRLVVEYLSREEQKIVESIERDEWVSTQSTIQQRANFPTSWPG